jgi:acetyltransferase-like isoleucine patch superfamily enzyme
MSPIVQHAFSKLVQTVPSDLTIDASANYTRLTAPEDSNWEFKDEASGVYRNGGARALPEKVRFDGQNNCLIIGGGVNVWGNVEIRGDNNIVYFGPGARLRRLHIEILGSNCVMAIGSQTTTEQAVFFVHRDNTHIHVGDDCMFSSGTVCRTYDGHGIFNRTTHEQINVPQSISIGAHTWVGNGAKVSKGVTVGSGCVIGQGSIVTSDTQANCVYAGVPARLVREDIVWARNHEYDAVPERFR